MFRRRSRRQTTSCNGALTPRPTGCHLALRAWLRAARRVEVASRSLLARQRTVGAACRGRADRGEQAASDRRGWSGVVGRPRQLWVDGIG